MKELKVGDEQASLIYYCDGKSWLKNCKGMI